MRVILLASLAIVCAKLALAEAPPSILSCTGAFAKDSDHARLVQIFGAANVTTSKIEVPDGDPVNATVIYAKDPKRWLEVTWMNEKARQNPNVIVRGDTSAWTTEDGLALSTSLQDVERRNGKPFKLSGFDWDYGGSVLDFDGGTLGKRPGGCHLGLTFAHAHTGDGAGSKVSGDQEFLSSNPAMRAAKPVVSQISIGWPQ